MLTGSHATLQIWAVSQLLCWLVSANTMLDIQLLKYSNIAEKRYDGQCCDVLCISSCDHKFDFCLDQHRPGNFETSRCSIKLRQTGEFPEQNVIVFGTHMSGVRNPIKYTFQGFPDIVDFKVGVSDDDHWWSGNDLVDTFKVSIGGPVYKAPSLAQWTNVYLLGQRSEDRSTLELNFRVYCMLNYYGDKCMIFCEAKSDITNGFYTCDPDTGAKVCRPGYLQVKDCKEKLDDCEGNECKNGATCVDLVNTYDCICPTAYTGGYCELLVDKCSFIPCQNGATCLRNGDDYTCQCTGGYVGRNCTLHRCSIPTTCHNGGTCYGAGQCLCPAGFYGDDCSQSLCQHMTCDNGGTCDSGKCFCKAGFTGVSCGIEFCDLITCHHGGTCRSGLCTCRAGYEGDQCEDNIDDCANEPCKNYGTCRDLVDAYRCKCLPGYDGRICENVVNVGTGYYEKIDQRKEPIVAPVSTKHESYSVNFEGWHIALLAIGIALIIALLLIVLLVTRHRRKSREEKTTTESSEQHNTSQTTFINDADQGAGVANPGFQSGNQTPAGGGAGVANPGYQSGNQTPAGGGAGGRGAGGAGGAGPGGAFMGLDANDYDSPRHGGWEEVAPALPSKTLPPYSQVSVYQHPPKPRSLSTQQSHDNDNANNNSAVNRNNSAVYERLSLDMSALPQAAAVSQSVNPSEPYTEVDPSLKSLKRKV